MGIAYLVWFLILGAGVTVAIVSNLSAANDDGAGALKNFFGYASLSASFFGLLLLLDYKRVFDLSRTKAGFKDKLGFVLAVTGLLAGGLSLFN